jgi:hypothetical protein
MREDTDQDAGWGIIRSDIREQEEHQQRGPARA